MDIELVQKKLRNEGLDAWLVTDYQQSNLPGFKFLKCDPEAHTSRRWFYLIPQQGRPVRVVHSVEAKALDHLPGETLTYFGRMSMIQTLKKLLTPGDAVAMEYSPMNRLPSVSRVDAGTIELIRSFDVDIMSSANLLQQFTSRWNTHALESHRKAASVLRQTVSAVWQLIQSQPDTGPLTEYDIQQFIVKQIESAKCVTDHPPIVAVDAHSADPHYSPTPENSTVIGPNQLVLIDLWCKTKDADAVYADVTWTAWTGPDDPDPLVPEIFKIVKDARDATLNAVREAFENERPVTGADLDRIARHHISKAGYGDFFVHRTGHSLDTDVHGAGANLDSLESEDDRMMSPGTGFTIEPGIYFPGKFGIRSEINVAILQDRTIEVTAQPVQETLEKLS
jgi:Xaa-Pro dipeptidase